MAASHFELLNRHHAESCGLLKGTSQPLKLQMVGAKPPKETPQQRPYVLFGCALAMSHVRACVRPSQQQLCATAIMFFFFQQRHCAPEIVMSVRRRTRRTRRTTSRRRFPQRSQLLQARRRSLVGPGPQRRCACCVRACLCEACLLSRSILQLAAVCSACVRHLRPMCGLCQAKSAVSTQMCANRQARHL